MKNIILLYPAFERGGVKLNFLNYLSELKKKSENIIILSDQNILKEIKLEKKIKFILLKKISYKFLYKYISSLMVAISILRLKKIIHKKNTRIISFQSSFFISILAKLIGVKLIIRVSEDPIGALNNSENYLNSILVKFTKYITYNLSYKILVNSYEMKKNVGKFMINKKKMCLQYNMNLIKINKFDIKKKKNIFLSVGRLCKQKNQTVIFYAFKIFLSISEDKDYLLYIVGDGPDKNKLLKLRNELNLNKKIRFLGWQKNTSKLMKKSKFLIFPSLYEGLPNALIEAVNNDLICLCTNVSGVKDICNKNFIPIENNYLDICEKMIYSIKNYKEIVKKNKVFKVSLKKFLISNLYKSLSNNIR